MILSCAECFAECFVPQILIVRYAAAWGRRGGLFFIEKVNALLKAWALIWRVWRDLRAGPHFSPDSVSQALGLTSLAAEPGKKVGLSLSGCAKCGGGLRAWVALACSIQRWPCSQVRRFSSAGLISQVSGWRGPVKLEMPRT